MLGYCCFLSVMHIISLCYVCLSSSTLLLLLFLGVFIVFAISKNNIIITFAYEILEGGSCMKWIRNAMQCHKGHYSNMIFNCKQNWAHYKMFIYLFLIYFQWRWKSRISITKKCRKTGYVYICINRISGWHWILWHRKIHSIVRIEFAICKKFQFANNQCLTAKIETLSIHCDRHTWTFEISRFEIFCAPVNVNIMQVKNHAPVILYM